MFGSTLSILTTSVWHAMRASGAAGAPEHMRSTSAAATAQEALVLRAFVVDIDATPGLIYARVSSGGKR